jgi:hypothetical protein
MLETAGAEIAYDVHDPLPTADGRPTLFMIGQPMDASGFDTLASHFPDRTVVTYDPRGLGRSVRKDGRVDHAPTVQADDVHAVIFRPDQRRQPHRGARRAGRRQAAPASGTRGNRRARSHDPPAERGVGVESVRLRGAHPISLPYSAGCGGNAGAAASAALRPALHSRS